MFTGIVEEIGRVAAVEHREVLTTLVTESRQVHEGAQLGDSIAVNGVCLTVVAIEGPRLTFEAVPETLRKTNLGLLEAGSPVNLERAVSAGRPMGGHYVQGHVD
ncbi:MAG: riboflavin synthase, partial [Myxococcales bacterium]|nr:riboflavin synthase [Myxococcales bacterium]